ncbi:MAG: DUF6175 family protein [Hallerella porci]|uniref:Lipoprotein n=1 Tax=Hallerella porci TaxID=1945871 RepID=A0ABX5LQ73_9BACT|nr:MULTISPECIES: DUF6175 family protein [Hallerella]MCI5601276.1 DUF6175 family protein [Hallerella sp.]MDY3922713.1 DUF6175 family protein [Hallerella porci]PWL01927.1 hypothetical protein B0H50_10916 [Hallerella porci]
MKKIHLAICGSSLFFLFACASQPKYQEVDVSKKSPSEQTALAEDSLHAVGESYQLTAAKQTRAQAAAPAPKKMELPKPTLIVIPAGTHNLNEALQNLADIEFAQDAENAINNYLTDKRYNVVALESAANTNEILSVQSILSPQNEDLSYVTGLSFGADICIKFNFNIHRKQILANLSAYESASGRLLGTQSSTVNDNGTNKAELVASAVHKALPSLLKKIDAYWKENISLGVPYKIILQLASTSETDENFHQITTQLKEAFVKIKANSVTETSVDLTVYTDPKKMESIYSVYAELQKIFSENYAVKKINVTQRLLILELNEKQAAVESAESAPTEAVSNDSVPNSESVPANANSEVAP